MPGTNSDSPAPAGTLDVGGTLKRQYHAGLQMLRQAIEPCPDGLWLSDEHPNRFWHVAYHVLYYTHLYLQPHEKDFIAWEHHREEYQFLGHLPWPPHDPPAIGDPYTRERILEYWRICDALVDDTVDRLDLAATDCGFWWYKEPKLEHQFINLRHLQHHTGQLADRLRRAADRGVDWISSASAATDPA